MESSADKSLQRKADGSGLMFDNIAEIYDRINRINSLGMDKYWRKITVKMMNIDTGHVVVDLATGTADLPIQICQMHPKVEKVIGIDPSEGMLDVGRTKITKAELDSKIELRTGDAQALELGDSSIDSVSMAFGIRNVPDRMQALKEMSRILKPGGRLAILELSEPRNGLLSFFARLHVRYVVPLLGRIFSTGGEYKYLSDSIEAFPRPEAFEQMIVEAGMNPVKRRSFAFGACVLYVAAKPQ